MVERLVLIGFGEAAQGFVPGLTVAATAYDRKTVDPSTRDAKVAEYRQAGITWHESAADALARADAVLSLVTADQALVAARASAGVKADAFWFDLNSVAGEVKREAAAAVGANGARYVDVAVLAPVQPQGTAVPLLLSGPDASAGALVLRQLGFTHVEVIEGPVGSASAVKMIRSVMIKGIEALCCECALAAEAAGVRERVIASLEASWPGAGWAARFDYNLGRMMMHGARRAAEMDQVVATLDMFGTGAHMSHATAARQRAIGALGLSQPPKGLDAKLEALRLVGNADEEPAV